MEQWGKERQGSFSVASQKFAPVGKWEISLNFSSETSSLKSPKGEKINFKHKNLRNSSET